MIDYYNNYLALYLQHLRWLKHLGHIPPRVMNTRQQETQSLQHNAPATKIITIIVRFVMCPNEQLLIIMFDVQN